jgi:hypothetical protein
VVAFVYTYNQHVLRNELKYKTDFTYNMFGPGRPWDNSNDNTGKLASVAQNPYLHLMIAIWIL